MFNTQTNRLSVVSNTQFTVSNEYEMDFMQKATAAERISADPYEIQWHPNKIDRS